MTTDARRHRPGLCRTPHGAACRRGRGSKVYGLDTNAATVDRAQRRPLPHRRRLRRRPESRPGRGFEATVDPAVHRRGRRRLVCVPTPLGEEGGPDLAAVRKAAEAIGAHVTPGTLAILESTTYPGTTEEVFAPLVTARGLEVGERRVHRLLARAHRPRQRELRRAEHAQGRRRSDRRVHPPRRRLLRAVRRHGRAGQGRPRGRDVQAHREHLPPREHRPGQRDAALLPRARHRPLERHRLRRDQAVRLHGLPPRPGRRRSLHPGRPVLPQPSGQGAARLLVPHGRTGRGDQHGRSPLRRHPAQGTAQRSRVARSRDRASCSSESPTSRISRTAARARPTRSRSGCSRGVPTWPTTTPTSRPGTRTASTRRWTRCPTSSRPCATPMSWCCCRPTPNMRSPSSPTRQRCCSTPAESSPGTPTSRCSEGWSGSDDLVDDGTRHVDRLEVPDHPIAAGLSQPLAQRGIAGE